MSDIYCNVRDFGAKGDGRTDDTDAFKSALAQAGKGHGCVLVPMGRYCIQPIKVPSHTTLFGNAAWGYSA
ncbi:glycosyl hydrolase family 28-related protein, partial [Neglectibacter timonensis]